MSRAEITRFIERMAKNMELHGREFRFEMPAGTPFERIDKMERDSGLTIPSGLRLFLEQSDGLECTSKAPHKNAELLAVPTLAQVLEYSANTNSSVIEMSEDSGIRAHDYIVCGLYLDDTFVIRDGDDAVLLKDLWIDHIDWKIVASSFDEWLRKSFESMATTANGFRFFEPIRTLW